MEDALLAFEGTLLLVSHDRALLEAVGTRTVAVDDGKLRSYEGGWQEYVRVREERRLAARAEKGKAGAAAKAGASAAKAKGAAKAAVVVQEPQRRQVAKSGAPARRRR